MDSIKLKRNSWKGHTAENPNLLKFAVLGEMDRKWKQKAFENYSGECTSLCSIQGIDSMESECL